VQRVEEADQLVATVGQLCCSSHVELLDQAAGESWLGRVHQQAALLYVRTFSGQYPEITIHPERS
jgi:hypothetical protein